MTLEVVLIDGPGVGQVFALPTLRHTVEFVDRVSSLIKATYVVHHFVLEGNVYLVGAIDIHVAAFDTVSKFVRDAKIEPIPERAKKMRKTGRSSRMFEDAIKQARIGRAVYVVAATPRHAHDLQHMLKIMAGEESTRLGIKFETPETLSNLDWTTMSLVNAHPNCVVIADHYAIEYHFAKMLEMMHRYDPIK